MAHCDESGGQLVSIESALLLVASSLVAAFVILTVNGSPAMDWRPETVHVKRPQDHRLPKLDTGKLIIDTDAGVDDAVALFLALGYEARQLNSNIRIMAITCVFGNTNVNNVAQNVLKVLKTANRLDIPVYSGASRSLLVTPPIDDFYGKDGLGDFVYPDPPNPADYLKKENAAVALVRLASQYPKQITLLCLGPLTNVALAIRLDPLFVTNLKQIVVLGGSTEGIGNVRPGIEFNFYADPEASFIVFDSVNATDNDMSPILLFPWESVVKRNTILMQWRKEVLGSVSSQSVRFLNLAERGQLNDSQRTDWHSADALVTAVTLDPSLMGQTSDCYNAMPEVQGLRARGSLFVDYNSLLKDAPCNVVIVEKVDILRYKRLLLSLLA